MNVLILSVTAGYGHHATAAAIADALEKRGATVKNIDLFKYINRVLYDTVDKGYLLSTKYLPRPYGQVYSTLEKNRSARRLAIGNIVTELLASRFASLFKDFVPDVVICSHIFALMLMDELKDRGRFDPPTIGVLTDYTFHPYWDDLEHIEYTVTGSPLMGYKVAKKGLLPERVLPFGIPIHDKFKHSVSREDARRALGLDPDRFTVLCMSGSMGYGDMTSYVEELDDMDEDFQMLCVCGRNEKTKQKLESMNYLKDVSIHGFVDNVELMMDAADCIVTKPGGLTTTECMIKRLPMVFISPIPGQEQRNSEFLTACGVAVRCTKEFSVAEAVYLLKNVPGRLEAMREAAGVTVPGDATERLMELVFSKYEK